MNNVFVGIIIMFLCNWYSRYYMQNSIDLLDDNQKLKLISLFKKNGKVVSLLSILLLVLYFVLIQLKILPTLYLIIIFFSLIISLIIYSYFKNLNILKFNDFPSSYLDKYLISFLIKAIGLFIFISIFLYTELIKIN